MRTDVRGPPSPHFPAQVAAPRGRLSFDTPENRFVKHVVGGVLSLVYRFADHPKLHAESESRLPDHDAALSSRWRQRRSWPRRDVSRVSRPRVRRSLKRTATVRYSRFWDRPTHHVSLPRFVAETTRLLEGRDMATLYEYWVFVKVLEAAVAVTGQHSVGPPRHLPRRARREPSFGLSTGLGPDITVSFNPTFNRSDGTAYSTPLRPDVILGRRCPARVRRQVPARPLRCR